MGIEPLKPISMDDLTDLIRVCEYDLLGRRDLALFLFLLDTGCRASERLAIKLDDINFPEGLILIRLGKGRKPRSVFISKKTKKI